MVRGITTISDGKISCVKTFQVIDGLSQHLIAIVNVKASNYLNR